MNLPFTIDQFFAVFAEYNESFWPVALVLWLSSATLVAAAWWRPARWSGPLSALLAAQWLWSGLAYHALLFTRINPAAWAFAALFVIQSALLFWKARASGSYFSRPGRRNAIGLGLACYALAYPLLSSIVHDYPATPTFGVPCPTDILTIGLLTTLRDTGLRMVIIPALWGLIGGSAAILLTVLPDYVLLAAGVFAIVMTFRT